MPGLRDHRSVALVRSAEEVDAPALADMPRVSGRGVPAELDHARALWSAAIRVSRARPREAALAFVRIADSLREAASEDRPYAASAASIRRLAMENALEAARAAGAGSDAERALRKIEAGELVDALLAGASEIDGDQLT